MKTVLRRSAEGSFLKDAARDLVVVIVGILAALWLEAWWQDLADRREERQILAGLGEEFRKNREDLVARIENWDRMISLTIELHELSGGTINEQTIAQFEEAGRQGIGGGGSVFFDPRHGQLTSVINSGKLGLISKHELRALIADWPALVADLDFEKDGFLEQIVHMRSKSERKYGRMWPDSRYELQAEALMTSQEYDNELASWAIMLRRMKQEGEVILQVTNDIIALIEDELGAS
jgi:hypothetical protein